VVSGRYGVNNKEATFENTLDRLESERESIEVAYQQSLSTLENRVQRLAAATEEVGRATRAREEARAEIVRRAQERLGGKAASAASTTPEWPSWPSGGGPVRRLVNGLMGRLMRDHLVVIDRRADRITERLDLLEGLFGDLLAATGGDVDVASTTPGAPSGEGTLSAPGAARAAFECAAEALAAAAEVHRGAHRVVNAKDAELLQRAAAGPLRRMELVFDEFARQQEALLAQLVGRRQELDALVADLRNPSDTP
jgi:hypothetical protein